MFKVNIKQLFRDSKEYLDQEIELEGWVRTSRAYNAFAFIELNDGSFFKNIQVMFESGLDNYEELVKVPIGSAVKIKGKLIKSEGKGQDYEVKANQIVIIAKADEDYPLQKKRHSFEFLRSIAHLRARSNTFSAVFRVRSVLSYAVHKFFQEKGFIHVHTPIITASDCEGAGEMFQVTTIPHPQPPLLEQERGLMESSSDNRGGANEVLSLEGKNDSVLDNKPLSLDRRGGGERSDKEDYSKDFFGKKAGLTVSGQLNGETMAMAYKNIYTFGPTFRAENSNTSRHAAEFWMIEPEIAFADLDADMNLAEEMVKYLINYVLKECPEEMEFFNRFIDKGLLERLDNIVSNKFARITYTEAIDILLDAKKKFEYPVEWGIDLQTEHERFLAEEVYNKPVFVTDYPVDIKAFYMRLNEDNKTVAAMDLLAPGVGEIIGGSQREDRLDILDKRMQEMDLSLEEYWWYRDIRRYGGVSHAGFGLGFERLIMYVTGMENIRDVIAFPRTPKNIDF